MERFFEAPFAGWRVRPFWLRRATEEIPWAPSLDMYEKADSFTVRLEIPGIKKEDIDVSVQNHTLTIKGERKSPAEGKDEEYQFCEIWYGSFSRSIMLPAAVDAGKIDAQYENGILEIHIPKAKEAKPAKIEVKAAA
jgi:HSP20 family protein